MNQEKIGMALKELRKQKGLTQEQLAEKFNTTNRSVSRWETGSNLPDISVLIDLAEFYDVELKDILSGNSKKENMEANVKETALLVADYTNTAKENLRKALHYLCLASVIGLLATLTIEFFDLSSPVIDFIAGLGEGLSLGSLVLSFILTSDNFEKFIKHRNA